MSWESLRYCTLVLSSVCVGVDHIDDTQHVRGLAGQRVRGGGRRQGPRGLPSDSTHVPQLRREHEVSSEYTLDIQGAHKHSDQDC